MKIILKMEQVFYIGYAKPMILLLLSLWLYRTGPPIVLYDYQPFRGGEYPRNYLSGFSGYLHVDGYADYHKVKNVILVGCWAHVRRKYDEALKAMPPFQGKTSTVAEQGL